jgi:hypothetical protein
MGADRLAMRISRLAMRIGRLGMRISRLATAIIGAAAMAAAAAHPVVYTVYAVTDGSLGQESFRNAQVRFALKSDTEHASMAHEDGADVYRNEQGELTVTIVRGGSVVTALVEPGQIYVRYDVTNGVVGFASYAIGPAYPLTLSCGVYSAFACPASRGQGEGFDQIVAALADIRSTPHDRVFYSAEVPSLVTTLAHQTLLTGYIGACAFPYIYGWCPGPPKIPIRTDHGDLYLQDEQASGTGMFTVEHEVD